MILATYDEWREHNIQLLESNPGRDVECPECHTEGFVMDDCRERVCQLCDGYGYVEYGDIKGLIDRGKVEILTKQEYFDACIQTIKDYCVWTGNDFLDVISQFIKEFRSA